MTRIQPSFEIDNKGRTLCQAHSKYFEFLRAIDSGDFFEDLQLENDLTCKTCSHYENDDCHFNKARVNDIDKKRNKSINNPFRCKLCGGKIHIMLTIMNKLHNEERLPHIKIPLICCNCYDSLNNKEFKRSTTKRILSSIEVMLMAIFFVYLVVFSYFLTQSLIFIIIPSIIAIFTISLAILRTRKIYFAIKGAKYHKKFFKGKES